MTQPRTKRSGLTALEQLVRDVITCIHYKQPYNKEILLELLECGPLRCGGVSHDTNQIDWDVLRIELLQFLQKLPLGSQYPRLALTVDTPTSFETAIYSRKRVGIVVTGSLRNTIILQFVAAIQEVGLSNIKLCNAPDCRHIYLKVYRRKFCSVQCQKRTNTRKHRQAAREHIDRRARRNRIRRTTAA